MTRTRVPNLVVVLLVSTAVLSGCLGAADDPDPDIDPPCHHCKDKVSDPSLGGIQGVVRDLDLLAVVGANVSLAELEEARMPTRADGSYAFADLEPGTYTVVVEADGYFPNGEQVTVEANRIRSVDIQLEPMPPGAEPYMAEMDFSGFIGCTAAALGLAPPDQCSATDQNAKDRLRLPLDAGLTHLVMHVVEEANGGSLEAPTLRFNFVNPATLTPTDYHMRGQPPFRAELDLSEHQWFDEELPGDAELRVRTVRGETQTDASVSYQYSYRAYFGVFYNGYPVPEGYSPVPDG